MSDMNSNPQQVLAPTWLIVTHLLGAAVMLYFVSYPTQPINPTQIATGEIINVAELDIAKDIKKQEITNAK